MFKKFFISFLLIIISIFQLNFFGWFPRQTKIIGDILLILLFIYLWFIKKPQILSDNAVFDLAKAPKRLITIFIAYVFFQVIYSFFLWGELFYVLQQSRRWVIASLYFFIVVSYSFSFNDKLIFKYLIASSFLITINILLLNNGFSFPSADSVLQAQGDILVFKPFIPGTVTLYFLFIYLTIPFFTKDFSFKKKTFYIILIFISGTACIELIPFRGWVISSFIGIIVSLLIFYKFKLLKIFKPVFVIIFLFIVIITTNFASGKIQWLTSSFIDISELKGDFLTRYITDISKLEVLETKIMFFLDGIGFVHQSSKAADLIGFSSETNDTGWVEILLTGGIIGSFIFLLVYFSILRLFIKLYFISKEANILILISIWIMSGLLLFSSNLLLWDFGFVPIALFSILILSKYYNNYENNNARWGTTPA